MKSDAYETAVRFYVQGKLMKARDICFSELERNPTDANMLVLLDSIERQATTRLLTAIFTETKKTASVLMEIMDQSNAKTFAAAPLEAFLQTTYLSANRNGHFHAHYIPWRATRIRKALEILGVNLRDKRILELGGGFGDIGSVFAQLGCNVTALEGRPANASLAKARYHDLPYHPVVFDLEKDFTRFGRFDVILCFGVIEVVQNTNNILSCCSQMADTVLLETMVCDSQNPDDLVMVDLSPKGSNDNPLSGKSPRPSPFFIERFFKQAGFRIERHFTADLNAGFHRYNWTHENTGMAPEGLRRFWCFRAPGRNPASPGV